MQKQHIEFSGLVQGGHFPPSVRAQISSVMKNAEGKRLIVAIREQRKQRSNPQNRFYWGTVIPCIMQMFIDAGNDIDKDACHEFLKVHVGNLKETITDPSGVKRSIALQSRKLSTLNWEDYITKIRAWAAEFDVMVPFPGEYQ